MNGSRPAATRSASPPVPDATWRPPASARLTGEDAGRWDRASEQAGGPSSVSSRRARTTSAMRRILYPRSDVCSSHAPIMPGRRSPPRLSSRVAPGPPVSLPERDPGRRRSPSPRARRARRAPGPFPAVVLHARLPRRVATHAAVGAVVPRPRLRRARRGQLDAARHRRRLPCPGPTSRTPSASTTPSARCAGCRRVRTSIARRIGVDRLVQRRRVRDGGRQRAEPRARPARAAWSCPSPASRPRSACIRAAATRW